jgi:hypothetical protein
MNRLGQPTIVLDRAARRCIAATMLDQREVLWRLFVVCLLATACGRLSWEERRDREETYNTADAIKLHPLGSSRADVLARYPSTNGLFSGRALSSVTRPDSGWPEACSYKFDENWFALRYERKSGAQIHHCIVVESPRVRGPYWIPDFTPGIWWDYLFFDGEERLIGVHRRFID